MSFLNEELISFIKECIYYPDETKYIEYSKLNNEYHSIDNNPSYVLYNINGDPDIIRYYNKGKLHRDTDNPSEIRLFNNIVIYQGWYKNGLKHRYNGPAEIYSDKNGKIQIEIWYKDGLKHRDGNLPAEYHLKFINDKYQYKEMIYYKEGKIHSDVCYSHIKYYENGNIKYKKWYTNDVLSSEDIPSVIGYYNNNKVRYEIWYKDGNKHHSQYNYQPSEIYYYSNGNIDHEIYYKEGLKHRDNLPAEIYYYENCKKQSEKYYKEDKLHRNDNLPTEIDYDENGKIINYKCYKEGKLHNERGPAEIYYYEDGDIYKEYWFLEGINYREGDNPCYTKYYPNNTPEIQIWNNKNGKLHRENDKPAEIDRYSNGRRLIRRNIIRYSNKNRNK